MVCCELLSQAVHRFSAHVSFHDDHESAAALWCSQCKRQHASLMVSSTSLCGLPA